MYLEQACITCQKCDKYHKFHNMKVFEFHYQVLQSIQVKIPLYSVALVSRCSDISRILPQYVWLTGTSLLCFGFVFITG